MTTSLPVCPAAEPPIRAVPDGRVALAPFPGKVRVIGSSTFPPELIVEAQWIADKCLRRR